MQAIHYDIWPGHAAVRSVARDDHVSVAAACWHLDCMQVMESNIVDYLRQIKFLSKVPPAKLNVLSSMCNYEFKKVRGCLQAPRVAGAHHPRNVYADQTVCWPLVAAVCGGVAEGTGGVP